MSSLQWSKTPSGAALGLLAALIVVCEVVPAVVALKSRRAMARTSSTLPSAPPPVAFSIVWPVLYLLAAGALWLQCTHIGSVDAGVRWSGVALLAAQLALGWAWTPVFAANKRREATWMIVAMLIATSTGLVLAARTSTAAAAMWAPYAAWLVFALVLSSEANGVGAVTA